MTSNTVSFYKYSGTGNDFILIDHRSAFFPLEDKKLMQRLCHRQQGVGADGIIFVESSTIANYRMRIFNADGSEAEMCGNGIRCFTHFLRELGETKSRLTIEIMHRLLSVEFEDENVRVDMGHPSQMRWGIPLLVEQETYTVDFLNTGVPHAVIFVEDLHKVDVASIGGRIRHHSAFQPHGTNVNFVKLLPNGELKVRTYERGVENETLACGTGATASAIAAAHRFPSLTSPIIVNVQSEEKLKIHLSTERGEVVQAFMTGPVALIFRGSFELWRNEFSTHFGTAPQNQMHKIACSVNFSLR